MWKSTYEIIYKALNYPPNKWDDKKEQTMVVVAESDSDAKIEAEKILKKQGYYFIHICSSKRLKYVNSNMKTEDLYKTKNEKPSKSGPIATLLSIILIPILIVVMISSCIKSKKPDGTWKLVEITGTADVRANYEQNYMELKDGTCTVYLELISPRKSDIKTYTYKGKKFENIEFEDSMIYTEGQRIVLHLQFEDNTYAFLRYERK